MIQGEDHQQSGTHERLQAATHAASSLDDIHAATSGAPRTQIFANSERVTGTVQILVFLRRTPKHLPTKLLQLKSTTQHAVAPKNKSTARSNRNSNKKPPNKALRAPNTLNSAAKIPNRRTRTTQTSNTSTTQHPKNKTTSNSKAVINNHTNSTQKRTPNATKKRKQTLPKSLPLS